MEEITKLLQLGFIKVPESNRLEKFFNLKVVNSINKTKGPVNDFPVIYSPEEILTFAKKYSQVNETKLVPFFGYLSLSIIPSTWKIVLKICIGPDSYLYFNFHEINKLSNYFLIRSELKPYKTNVFCEDDEKGEEIMIKKAKKYGLILNEDYEELVKEGLMSYSFELKDNDKIKCIADYKNAVIGILDGNIILTTYIESIDPYEEEMSSTLILKTGPAFIHTISALQKLKK